MILLILIKRLQNLISRYKESTLFFYYDFSNYFFITISIKFFACEILFYYK